MTHEEEMELRALAASLDLEIGGDALLPAQEEIYCFSGNHCVPVGKFNNANISNNGEPPGKQWNCKECYSIIRDVNRWIKEKSDLEYRICTCCLRVLPADCYRSRAGSSNGSTAHTFRRGRSIHNTCLECTAHGGERRGKLHNERLRCRYDTDRAERQHYNADYASFLTSVGDLIEDEIAMWKAMEGRYPDMNQLHALVLVAKEFNISFYEVQNRLMPGV